MNRPDVDARPDIGWIISAVNVRSYWWKLTRAIITSGVNDTSAVNITENHHSRR